MPITRKWNIARRCLMRIRDNPLRANANTSPSSTSSSVASTTHPSTPAEVVALLEGMQAKVNLIVWNPGPDMPFAQPSPAAVSTFQQHLIANGIPTFIRRPRGRDIYAACGQLKRTVEATPPPSALVSIAPPATPPA